MREVYLAGGPSIGYQCEVENGKKQHVHTDKLAAWLGILAVPEALVRGHYRPYHEAPARGLAASIRDELLALQSTPEWAAMRTQERLMVALRSLTGALTKPVTAYVLGLDFEAL
ncbi:MAG TPA: hypothetical protein VNT75_10920, partial [Symbiobacteriaceae bacterium]|nr:hypothetical protein [Symbiobacteriaceae bacterium]